jgi:hypothetical protein
MKQLLLLLAIAGLFACNGDVNSSHEAQWSKDGKDSVVYVRYKEDNGNWVNFYMQYMLFQSLFNSGGYNACYGHYQQNAGHYTVSNRYYSNYQPRTRVGPSTTGHHVPAKSSSSPSRSWSSGSSSSHSSSPSRSSSSPSRSSGSSYSSPSRSSSSSSRSYSSPSRSYSSPSRSYSSPSRH